MKMALSFRKIWAVSTLRLHSIIKNPTLVMFPFIAIGYVLIFKSIIKPGHGPAIIWILSLGVLFNIVMTSMMFSTMPLADERDKGTLPVLLNSGVKDSEYLYGSAIPVILIVVITNLLSVMASGISWQQLSFGKFLLLSVITCGISIMLGDIFAILMPNQTMAGFLTLPAMFILAILPMFKVFSSTVKIISDLTYSGVLMNFMIKRVATGSGKIGSETWLILLVWVVISRICLIYVYRRKGLVK